jgi:hypothetical protein
VGLKNQPLRSFFGLAYNLLNSGLEVFEYVETVRIGVEGAGFVVVEQSS